MIMTTITPFDTSSENRVLLTNYANMPRKELPPNKLEGA
jgi:hypothetical protein